MFHKVTLPFEALTEVSVPAVSVVTALEDILAAVITALLFE